MNAPRRRWTILLLSGIILLLTGCGSSTPDESASFQTSRVAAPRSTTTFPPRQAHTSTAPQTSERSAFTPGTGATVPRTASEPHPVRVPLLGVGAASGGMDVRVIDVRRAHVQGSGPGEISGPAVVATLRLRNHTPRPFSLTSAVATLQLNGKPASPFAGPPSTGWGETLAAGTTRDVVLAFAAPAGALTAELTVSVKPTEAALLFVGPIPAPA